MPVWDSLDMRGRNIAITNATSRVGLDVARRFVEGGANVLLVDGDARSLYRAAARLRAGPGRVRTLVAEIGAEDTPREIVAHAVNGLGSLDVLVVEAGTDARAAGALGKEDPRGIELVVRAAGRRMSDQTDGRIIVIGARGELLELTRALAALLAPSGVRVNAVVPAEREPVPPSAPVEAVVAPVVEGEALVAERVAVEDVVTERVPTERVVPERLVPNPADIAKVAVFLASPASSYMTGARVVVDGGRSLP